MTEATKRYIRDRIGEIEYLLDEEPETERQKYEIEDRLLNCWRMLATTVGLCTR